MQYAYILTKKKSKHVRSGRAFYTAHIYLLSSVRIYGRKTVKMFLFTNRWWGLTNYWWKTKWNWNMIWFPKRTASGMFYCARAWTYIKKHRSIRLIKTEHIWNNKLSVLCIYMYLIAAFEYHAHLKCLLKLKKMKICLIFTSIHILNIDNLIFVVFANEKLSYIWCLLILWTQFKHMRWPNTYYYHFENCFVNGGHCAQHKHNIYKYTLACFHWFIISLYVHSNIYVYLPKLRYTNKCMRLTMIIIEDNYVCTRPTFRLASGQLKINLWPYRTMKIIQ